MRVQLIRRRVWVGNRLESNFLVPWESLTFVDHWLSGAEYHRQNARDREKREKERRKTAERLMKADEAAIAREMKASWLKRRGVE